LSAEPPPSPRPPCSFRCRAGQDDGRQMHPQFTVYGCCLPASGSNPGTRTASHTDIIEYVAVIVKRIRLASSVQDMNGAKKRLGVDLSKPNDHGYNEFRISSFESPVSVSFHAVRISAYRPCLFREFCIQAAEKQAITVAQGSNCSPAALRFRFRAVSDLDFLRLYTGRERTKDLEKPQGLNGEPCATLGHRRGTKGLHTLYPSELRTDMLCLFPFRPHKETSRPQAGPAAISRIR